MFPWLLLWVVSPRLSELPEDVTPAGVAIAFAVAALIVSLTIGSSMYFLG